MDVLNRTICEKGGVQASFEIQHNLSVSQFICQLPLTCHAAFTSFKSDLVAVCTEGGFHNESPAGNCHTAIKLFSLPRHIQTGPMLTNWVKGHSVTSNFLDEKNETVAGQDE